MHREVQLIVLGGIRSRADVAKALALGADAVSIGAAALIALGDNAPDRVTLPFAYQDEQPLPADVSPASGETPPGSRRLTPVLSSSGRVADATKRRRARLKPLRGGVCTAC
jgi:glutamate synthase domain-containing protein 2